jgi:CspA family cold shock protein
MASGTVKWFNATKGFGFIRPDSGGKDVFVHFSISAVERAGLFSLNEGQKINYEVQTERGREAAVNLKKDLKSGQVPENIGRLVPPSLSALTKRAIAVQTCRLI